MVGIIILSVLTQPCEIYCNLFAKIISNVVQRLILVPLAPPGPELIQDLSGIEFAVGLWLFWIHMSSLDQSGNSQKKKLFLIYLTSWTGKDAWKAPSSKRRPTPTSPFFSLPNGVVHKISYTIRERCALEKKFSLSSLPRNLQIPTFSLQDN